MTAEKGGLETPCPRRVQLRDEAVFGRVDDRGERAGGGGEICGGCEAGRVCVAEGVNRDGEPVVARCAAEEGRVGENGVNDERQAPVVIAQLEADQVRVMSDE